MGFFPCDAETLKYLRLTGRPEHHVKLVEAYCREQGLFRTDDTPDPAFTDTLQLDLGTVEPSIAGPKRPQDRVPLKAASRMYAEALEADLAKMGTPSGVGEARMATAASASPEKTAALMRMDTEANPVKRHYEYDCEHKGQKFKLRHGSVVIAAITSCTNTSNPSVMLGAGLLARKAVQKGLKTKPWVKTSLAPGSKVVTE
jgi:aconitate hydratase